MPRRISTKLVLAVLTAVVLPFALFALFIDHQMQERLTRDVVKQSLKALAQDLAGQVDHFVDERRQDVAQWANHPLAHWAIQNHRSEIASRARNGGGAGSSWGAAQVLGEDVGTAGSVPSNYRAIQTREFDRYVGLELHYDLLLLVASDGRLVTCNGRAYDGSPLPRDFLEALFEVDFSEEEWFQSAIGDRTPAQENVHRSIYQPFVFAEEGPDRAANYAISFAEPVFGPRAEDGEPEGVFYALVNWKPVQDLVSSPIIKEYFAGLVTTDGGEPSPYAWIWDSDGDTIIAHDDPSLYGESVATSPRVALPQLTAAVQDERFGLYPRYRFRGVEKHAAFKRTAPEAAGGFDWVVGVGINDADIFAVSSELQRILLTGTAGVLLLAVALTLVIARRATRPIQVLQETARRIAEGDLDARVDIRSKDELGMLARDFNEMTRKLAEHRARLVKAEKDAAWREMARQIAHDIKNPLTPIQLSLDLVERARRERNPGYEEILERTLDMIARQVRNLREIAGDFYEFTGGRRPEPQEIDLGALVDEVLALHDPWAVEQGVDVRREGDGGIVLADRAKLRRVLGNLVSNALQAMPEGGTLRVDVASLQDVDAAGRVRVLVQDDGPGVPDHVLPHLFEPYFTTKSEGTGLGLAIARRAIEELGGSIELRPAREVDPEAERGTVAAVTLPLRRAAGGDIVAGADPPPIGGGGAAPQG